MMLVLIYHFMIPSTSTHTWSEYFVDDVSCIPIDPPSYAGYDTTPAFPEQTVYIGRTRDVGIDEACTVPATEYDAHKAGCGRLIGKSGTNNYVCGKATTRCSGIKYDTVVVFKDALGLRKAGGTEWWIKNLIRPAKNAFSIEAANKSFGEDLEGLTLYDASETNQLVRGV